jgi:hypothetical protein
MPVYPFCVLCVFTKASDGITTPKKKDPYDIDAPDSCNELAVVEYVEDIYRFYKSTEVKIPSGNFYHAAIADSVDCRSDHF